MPNLKSSQKRLRQNRKARERNRAARSQLRNTLKRVKSAPDAAGARALLPEAMSAIDRSVKKGVLHKNTAARYKSRLVHRINTMGA